MNTRPSLLRDLQVAVMAGVATLALAPRRIRLSLALWVSLLACPAHLVAGPPLVTDDTGTVEAGQYEVLVYAAGEHRDTNDSAELPGLEITYGLNAAMDLSFTIPRQVTDGEPVFSAESDATDSDSESGLGEASIGWKWRFYDRAVSVAFAPSYSFPMSSVAQIRGLIEDSEVLSLPVIVTTQTHSWELGGQLGYDLINDELDAVVYGIYAANELTDGLRVLGEIWGADFVNDGNTLGFTNWRVGLEWSAFEHFTILAALGGGVSSDLEPDERLRRDYFFGVAWDP